MLPTLLALPIGLILAGLPLGCGTNHPPANSSVSETTVPPTAAADTAAGSNRIKHIEIIQESGSRPHFSPDGQRLVFDRKNPDGFYDLYLAGLHDTAPYSLTEGRSALSTRNHGNGIFHPSGRFIVFISEAPRHFQDNLNWLGDPGIGMYCDLWATDTSGTNFWRLTNHPAKMSVFDRVQAISVVNPHFSHDGTRLIWTERYAAGGHHNWGKWRVMMAEFEDGSGSPRLTNPRAVIRAEDYGPDCNYVTAMGFLPGDTTIIVAGNLEGQHEFGMDQYLFALPTRRLVNLHPTPEYWEEDASLHPNGTLLVSMSNATSRYRLDFDNPGWPTQPREREYWLLDLGNGQRERLTFFNEPSAREFTGRRTIVAASDFSPDGRYLAASIGLDRRADDRADIELKLVLIEFNEQSPAANPQP